MLTDRGSERATLDELLAGAKLGRSGVLVLRGEAGIGKSALLQYAAERAEGCRVLRAIGAEWEMELPFFRCASCGSGAVTVASGNEFEVESIEVEEVQCIGQR